MSRTRKRKFGSTFIFVNCFDSFGCGGGALSNPIPIFLSITILILCLNQLAIYAIETISYREHQEGVGWIKYGVQRRDKFVYATTISFSSHIIYFVVDCQHLPTLSSTHQECKVHCTACTAVQHC